MEWSKSVWGSPVVSAKKIGHLAPLPTELSRRLIEFCSFKNNVALDPFIGSRTTALVAIELDRNFIGYETDVNYIKLTNSKLKEARNTLF